MESRKALEPTELSKVHRTEDFAVNLLSSTPMKAQAGLAQPDWPLAPPPRDETIGYSAATGRRPLAREVDASLPTVSRQLPA